MSRERSPERVTPFCGSASTRTLGYGTSPQVSLRYGLCSKMTGTLKPSVAVSRGREMSMATRSRRPSWSVSTGVWTYTRSSMASASENTGWVMPSLTTMPGAAAVGRGAAAAGAALRTRTPETPTPSRAR